MSARDYAVTFPYGATTAPYSVSSPHRGNDRPCPTGTPVVIGDTTIGWTGSTGWATGPHLHTQAGSDLYCQQTFNPTGLEFRGGTVAAKGWADQWGNYVIIQTNAGYICYAHLSQTNVTVGQVVGGVSTGGTAVDTIKSMYWRLLGREADQGGIDTYVKAAGERGWEFVYNDLKNSAEGQADWDRRNPTRVAGLEQQLADVRKALVDAQNKPPVEVVKVVEKIVEKPVGGIDEQTKATINETNAIVKWIQSLLSKIFK